MYRTSLTSRRFGNKDGRINFAYCLDPCRWGGTFTCNSFQEIISAVYPTLAIDIIHGVAPPLSMQANVGLDSPSGARLDFDDKNAFQWSEEWCLGISKLFIEAWRECTPEKKYDGADGEPMWYISMKRDLEPNVTYVCPHCKEEDFATVDGSFVCASCKQGFASPSSKKMYKNGFHLHPRQAIVDGQFIETCSAPIGTTEMHLKTRAITMVKWANQYEKEEERIRAGEPDTIRTVPPFDIESCEDVFDASIYGTPGGMQNAALRIDGLPKAEKCYCSGKNKKCITCGGTGKCINMKAVYTPWYVLDFNGDVLEDHTREARSMLDLDIRMVSPGSSVWGIGDRATISVNGRTFVCVVDDANDKGHITSMRFMHPRDARVKGFLGDDTRECAVECALEDGTVVCVADNRYRKILNILRHTSVMLPDDVRSTPFAVPEKWLALARSAETHAYVGKGKKDFHQLCEMASIMPTTPLKRTTLRALLPNTIAFKNEKVLRPVKQNSKMVQALKNLLVEKFPRVYNINDTHLKVTMGGYQKDDASAAKSNANAVGEHIYARIYGAGQGKCKNAKKCKHGKLRMTCGSSSGQRCSVCPREEFGEHANSTQYIHARTVWTKGTSRRVVQWTLKCFSTHEGRNGCPCHRGSTPVHPWFHIMDRTVREQIFPTNAVDSSPPKQGSMEDLRRLYQRVKSKRKRKD